MKKLVEKFGIADIERDQNYILDLIHHHERKIKKLKLEINEILEALIELADWYKQHTGLPPVKAFSVIKKATGKTWEEVKEIINV